MVTMEAYQTLMDINFKLLKQIDTLNSKLESTTIQASSHLPFTEQHKREQSQPQKPQEFSDLYFPSSNNQTLQQDYYSGSRRAGGQQHRQN